MPKISIIIPVHNTYQYLKRCIDSISLTSNHTFEIIVIDNNSNDKDRHILDKYEFVKYIELDDNLGPGGARNIGIMHSEAEYIGFCDSDDWIDSNFYTDIIDMMDKSAADIGIGGIKRNFAYMSNERIIKCRFDKEYILNSDMLFRIMTKEYDTGILIPPSSVNKVYRKSFVINNSLDFKEKKYYEDLLFSIKAVLTCQKAICVPNTYYHHYKRIGSITQSFTQKHIDDFKTIFIDIKNYMLHTGVYNSYIKGYYKFAEHFFNLVIRQLFEYECNEDIRKEHIKSALTAFGEIIDFDEYISCYTSEDLRRHIQPLIKDTTIN